MLQDFQTSWFTNNLYTKHAWQASRAQKILQRPMMILMNIKMKLPAGFPSLERTLVGGGLLIACSLLSCRSCSNRSLVERSRDLGREREMTFSSELWSLSLARCRLRPTRVPSSKLLSAGLLSYRWDLKKRQHL